MERSSGELALDAGLRRGQTADDGLRSIARRQLLRRLPPLGGGFESSRYLGKWLLLGLLVGVVAGLGAVVFFRALELATRLLLVDLAGYRPPLPVGEGSPLRGPLARPWLLPLVTALGGLLSGIIVFRLAPEAEGHGTDAAIAAIHHKRGKLRGRVVPIKLVASAITIGSGGSGGREGPAAQISAGFGSLLGGWLKLDAQDRRILVAAGMGAGIGAVMAAEILYIHDLEVEALIPALIASIVGYTVFGSIEGLTPIFGAQPGPAFEHPLTLVYYAGLGVRCGLVGLLYATSFYGVTALSHRLRPPRMLEPALGVLLVGLSGLEPRGVLRTGYGGVQIGMSNELLTLPLWLVLASPFAKILATSLSIGSGGSGGIFGPRHGDRRDAGRVVLACRAWRAAAAANQPRAVRDRRHDGALRRHRPRAAGGDADGGRDDRRPLAAGAGHGRHRPLDAADRRHDHLPRIGPDSALAAGRCARRACRARRWLSR